MRKETCHEKKFGHFWQRNACEHKLPHVLHAKKQKKKEKKIGKKARNSNGAVTVHRGGILKSS